MTDTGVKKKHLNCRETSSSSRYKRRQRQVLYSNTSYIQKVTLGVDSRKETEFMYDVQMIARYIINRCDERERPISNSKLQKILYFIQAEFLVNLDKPCFSEEIQAWNSGPVVPEVYKQYRAYGATNIPAQKDEGFELIFGQDKEHLDAIIDNAAKYSASGLAEITRRQSPWKNAHKKSDCVIRQSVIKEYFASDKGE